MHIVIKNSKSAIDVHQSLLYFAYKLKSELTNLKFFVLIFLLLASVQAKYQSVYIGNIDPHYKNKISKKELRNILNEIELQFETQLGYNVFDYSTHGKPINIVYIQASYKKQKILNKQKKSQAMKKNIQAFSYTLEAQNKQLKVARKSVKTKYSLLNHDINSLNTYIKQCNNRNTMSKATHDTLKKEITQKQNSLKKRTLALNKEKNNLNKKIAETQNKTHSYNALIRRYNRLQREIERLSNNFVEVKGITKSNTMTHYKTTIKNGKRSTTTTRNTTMQKIEIYDFEDAKTLKVILAHELGHLVGVAHINVAGALMNPRLQDKQKEHLSLSYDDIRGFDRAFNK